MGAFDFIKTTAFLCSKVQEIQKSMVEIRRYVGKGKVNFEIETKKDVHIRIIVTNPTQKLEELANNLLLLLPNIQVPGVRITLELTNDEQKLIKEIQ